MPAYQGEFDGLCGMYAIANAYEICGFNDSREELFMVACNVLAQSRWPGVLEDGTTFRDMQRMISQCQTQLEDQYDENKLVSVTYPFSRNVPRNDKEYWNRLHQICSSDEVYCCIVRRTKPSSHWLVTYPYTTRRVHFVDSDPFDPEFGKNRGSLYAGNRRRRRNQWRFDRHDLIVFSD